MKKIKINKWDTICSGSLVLIEAVKGVPLPEDGYNNVPQIVLLIENIFYSSSARLGFHAEIKYLTDRGIRNRKISFFENNLYLVQQ